MKTTCYLIVTCMALLVAGCSDCLSGPAKAEQELNGSIATKKVPGGNVSLVTLEDGTECAIFSGGYKGGIHCNWKGK